MEIVGVLENLVSDIIFLVSLIIFGWLVFRVTYRSKMIKFFGLTKTRRVSIYLSNIRVKKGGSLGVNNLERSYRGSAVAFGEMLVTNKFQNLFNYFLPSLSDNPGFLSKILISDVTVNLICSPLIETDIEIEHTIITIGSPAYNKVSEVVEKTLSSKAKFDVVNSAGQSQLGKITSNIGTENKGDMGPAGNYTDLPSDTGVYADPSSEFSTASSGLAIFPSQNPMQFSTGGTIPPQPSSSPQSLHPYNDLRSAIIVEGVPPLTDPTYGFVECLHDHTNNRLVFYVAGISELATVGAANYLISEWKKLYQKYGLHGPFLVLLKFDPQNYQRWSIIFER